MNRRWLTDRSAALVMAAACAISGYPVAGHDLERLVRPLAEPAVTGGTVVGLGVAVIDGDRPPQFFTYGNASLAPDRPFTPDTVTEIGSVTKVFTTNLLGQAVAAGRLRLDLPLSEFRAQLGKLRPATSRVTLKELGDFTAGIADVAPLCLPRRSPGCLPNFRPTPRRYSAQDFAKFFRYTLPMNFGQTPPVKAREVPTAYYYSNFSIGLIGLLLGSTPGRPLSNDALTGWHAELRRHILEPLGMGRTYLHAPDGLPDVAQGYQPALATAEVDDGRIAAITLASSGGNYNSAPPVRIIGGGGAGAIARAHVEKGQLTDIVIVSMGHGYIAPARVILTGAGATTIAQGAVRVEDGKVAAIALVNGGAGYTRLPEVRVSGGRLLGGRDATAKAAIANGQVVGFEVTDPGAGYVPPLAVVVAPGAPMRNAIPVWAPAGALNSTLRDMARFATAALGRHRVEGHAVPISLTKGFRIAQRPYACESDTPALATCQPSQNRSALAWRFYPADPEHRMPSMLGKNGALPGFSAELVLMPEAHLAVVALTNSNSFLNATGVADVVAEPIAFNVLQAVLRTRSR